MSEPTTVGARMIVNERERQLKLWDEGHDAKHVHGELAEAAIVYVRCALTAVNPHSSLAAAPMPEPPSDWPWEQEWFKPSWSDPVRNLVKAGALIAAELDRLHRG